MTEETTKTYPIKRKINIGAGEKLLDDWFNFDCQVFERDGKRTDKPLGRAEDLAKIFPENWFNEALCIHTIEHFYAEDAINVLSQIYFILASGGKLTIEAPDIYGCFRRYKDPLLTIRHLYAPSEPRLQWGEHWTHKSGWTVSLAANRLKKIGFVIVEASNEGCLYHRMSNQGVRDFHVVAVKPKSVDRITINDHEKSVYSQNGEDGIIHFLVSQIGKDTGTFIEIGSGAGLVNCTSYLARKLKWSGIWINNTPLSSKVSKIVKKLKNIHFYQEQVSPRNVNSIIKKYLPSKKVDILSIDIDGLDYWVWEAITEISPRIVVIEYNASFGFHSIVVRNIDPFSRYKIHKSGFYHGASLVALTKLAKKKRYTLVGCDSTGVNAFFVRSDLMGSNLKELTPEQAYFWPAHRFGIPEEHMKELRKMKFMKV